MCMSLSLSLSLHIYIYIYICIMYVYSIKQTNVMCMCVYIYIYIHRERERERLLVQGRCARAGTQRSEGKQMENRWPNRHRHSHVEIRGVPQTLDVMLDDAGETYAGVQRPVSFAASRTTTRHASLGASAVGRRRTGPSDTMGKTRGL